MARRSGIRQWKNCIGQEPMFKPDSDWVAPNLSDLPSWQGISRIGLDTEGCDPTLTTLGPGVRRNGYTCGISFAIEDGPAYYLPTRHHGGGNLDPAKVEQYMKDQAKIYTGAICGANLQYDLDFLAEQGIVFRHATFLDIQVAEPLIDENQQSYSLETLAQKYGFMGKDETLLIDAAAAYGFAGKDIKKNLWQLPAKFVGPYAIEDAVLPLKILRKQEKIIDDQELWDIYRLECKVLPILVKMRRRGIRIDFDQLDKVEALTRVKELEYLDRIHHITGVRIKINEITKPKLVIAALDTAQIPYGRTEPTEKFPEGQPSVKKEFLEPNIDQPLVEAILEARSYNKVRNTFVKSIRRHETNGRLHCTFNQLKTQDDNSDEVKGAGPGRLSSRNPNCFADDTEVLTENGWVLFRDLSQGVRVAEYLNGEIKFSRPESYISYQYSGQMVEVHGPKVDLKMTPDHRCLLFTQGGQQQFVPASEYAKRSGSSQLHSGVWCGEAKDQEVPTIIQLAVAVQADGALRGNQIRFFFAKTRKANRLRNILAECGIPYNDTIVKSHTPICISFTQDERVMEYLTKTKEFSRKIVTSSINDRVIFLNELSYWDGTRPAACTKTHRYFTTSTVSAEIVSEVAARSGWKIAYRYSKTWANNKPFHDLSLSPRDRTKTHGFRIKTSDYSGKVYCVTMPTGTVVVRRNGKFCVTGNCQQQPSRHPVLGKMWRSIYLPDEGGRWASLDFSQAEPRLFIHFAHIAGCAGTQAAVDGFHAGLDWHDMTTELAFGVKKADDPEKFAKLRKRAKVIFLGKVYGLGQAKMCHACGFSTEFVNIRGAEREVAGPEGKRFLAEFNAKVPFLAELNSMVERVAWNRKYIITILGRHIHYPPGQGQERKALNNLLQGSSADQIKLAMVLMDAAGHRIQLQMHDEFGITVYDENGPKEMAKIMTNCVPLIVPSKVDIEIGNSWGDSMKG